MRLHFAHRVLVWVSHRGSCLFHMFDLVWKVWLFGFLFVCFQFVCLFACKMFCLWTALFVNGFCDCFFCEQLMVCLFVCFVEPVATVIFQKQILYDVFILCSLFVGKCEHYMFAQCQCFILITLGLHHAIFVFHWNPVVTNMISKYPVNENNH